MTTQQVFVFVLFGIVPGIILLLVVFSILFFSCRIKTKRPRGFSKGTQINIDKLMRERKEVYDRRQF